MFNEETFVATPEESKQISAAKNMLLIGLAWLVVIMRYVARRLVEGLIENVKDLAVILSIMAALSGAALWVILFMIWLEGSPPQLEEVGERPLAQETRAALKQGHPIVNNPPAARLATEELVGFSQGINKHERRFETIIEGKREFVAEVEQLQSIDIRPALEDWRSTESKKVKIAAHLRAIADELEQLHEVKHIELRKFEE